ncbi:hyalin repeat protein [unidentified eubacterium SCB49]|nr:hyalin repeat protein [unidentified eubacterium SCB49]
MKKITLLCAILVSQILFAQTVPTIDCPSNITVPVLGGSCDSVVTFNDAVANDTEDGALTVTQTMGLPSGSAFPLGVTTIEFTATDSDSNTVSCQFTITVEDNQAPIALCQNFALELDANGLATLDPSDIDAGSFDTCGVASLSISREDFSCTDLFTTTIVTLTVTDTSGNFSTCDAEVTVIDMLIPTITCPDAITVITDVDSCTATGVVLGTATAEDNCGIASITNDAPAAFPQGVTTVTWTATDFSGNIATCTQTVTVNDAVIPNAVCQNITVQLDETGMVVVTPEQVDGGSTDNCGIASMELSNDTFSCDDIGSNNVALTVTDTSGNINACVVDITVEDSLAPTVVCQNITVMLDAAGVVIVDPSQIDNGSTDNCAIDTYTLSQTDFTCANLGENTVTLTVTDVNGNSEFCEAIVTVVDDIAPTAICQNFTVSVDNEGNATILPTDIDNNSFDNCGIATLELDITTFTCDDIGDNAVTLTVTDTSGNESTCTATVTVVDETAPVIQCQNLELELDETGMVTILPSDAILTAEDGCGVSTITVSQDSFSCDDLGDNEVTVTVTDTYGNETECIAIITIVENTLPIVVCQDITVSLDENGLAVITADEIDGGSTDNCGIDSIAIDIDNFTCDNVGENEVTLLVLDVNGNMAECIATVTVVDDMAPIALCQDITINLDGENGVAQIDASQIDGGSTDNCGISSIQASLTMFDCSHLGENIVTLTVTDIYGNESECEATVTVTATDAPEALCQNISVILDENGEAFIEPGDIYSGDSATCNLSIDISTFSCDDIGTPVEVTLTSSNGMGDETSCTALVNVVDNIAPVIICPEETVIIAALTPYELPNFGDDGTVQVIDNCADNVIFTQEPPAGTLVEEGETEITITATDPSGNEATCEFVIFVDPSLDTNSYAAQLKEITLFPNPANSFITLGNPNNLELKKASLTDVTGRVLKTFILTQTGTERILDISEIASASYFLVIEGTEANITFQVIKK